MARTMGAAYPSASPRAAALVAVLFSVSSQVVLAGWADGNGPSLMRKQESSNSVSAVAAAGADVPYEEVDSQLAAFAAASLNVADAPPQQAEAPAKGHTESASRARRKRDNGGAAAALLGPSGEVSSAALLESSENDRKAQKKAASGETMTVAVEAEAFAKAWEDASDTAESMQELQLAGQLLEMEKDVVNTTDTKQQGDLETRRMHGLLDWAKRHGIQGVEDLKVAYFPKGPKNTLVRGLALTKNVKKGEAVLKVPSHLIISSYGNTTKAAFRTAGVPAPVVNGGGLDPLMRMSAGLLALRQQAFPTWEGWIRSLPGLADYREYHPLTAKSELLKTFEDLPLTKRVQHSQRTKEAQLNMFQELGGIASGDDWEWAHVTVTSRCWAHRDRAGNKGLMIVPVADFINSGTYEDQNIIAHIGSPENGDAFVYTARNDIPAGTELIGYHSPASESDDYAGSWDFVVDDEHRPVWTAPPPRLSRETCGKLSSSLADALSDSGKCRAPDAEQQKGVYCTLARLTEQTCEPAQRRLQTGVRLALVLCAAAAIMLIAAPAVAVYLSKALAPEAKKAAAGEEEAEEAAKKPKWSEDLSTPKKVKEPPRFGGNAVEELYQLLYGEEAGAAREAHGNMAAAATSAMATWTPFWLRGQDAEGSSSTSAAGPAAPWNITPHGAAGGKSSGESKR